MTITTSLPEMGFLSNASDELKRVLEALATEVSLDKDEVLFEQGEEGAALYALVRGAMEISVISQDGRKLALDVMRTGAILGEIAMFDPGVRTATVTALEPSHLLRVRNADIMREVQRAPALAIDLIRLAGKRMRWMNKQLNEQVFLPMSSRLARKVLYLTDQIQGNGGTLKLSQTELAEFVGATREAVSKTIAGWKRMGVVDPGRGGLVILDRAALQAMADLDQI